MTPDEIAEIARGLSRAQRERILAAKVRFGLGIIRGQEPMQVRPGGACVALCKKGLIRDSEVISISGKRSRIYALTETGQQVRSHLIEQERM